MYAKRRDPVTSSSADRDFTVRSLGAEDHVSADWEREGSAWDDVSFDARDLLSVLSSLLESGVANGARTDL
jgi:hypothetical protein